MPGRQGLAAEGQPARQGRGHRHVGQKHGEHDHDEVVHVVGRFLRHHRLDVVIGRIRRTEALAAHDKAHDAGQKRADDERAEHDERNRVALEGVHRLHEARTGDEVPSTTKQKVRQAQNTLQRLKAPRWRYTVKEWMSATPTSHGSRLAFSTGSQPQ